MWLTQTFIRIQHNHKLTKNDKLYLSLQHDTKEIRGLNLNSKITHMSNRTFDKIYLYLSKNYYYN